MLKDFRAFILRGNVIDLAVGVAIGAAFGTVVASFTKNLLTPLLAIPGDKASFASLDFTISGSRFGYGAVIDDIISFVLVAAVLFFLVVRPVNKLMERRRTEPEVEANTRECPECLSSIPVSATRCAFCTTKLTVTRTRAAAKKG
jgi:large conductance mechanosensitive channel